MTPLTRISLALLLLATILCPHPGCGASIEDALRAGDLEKFKALLKSNPASINTTNEAGETFLHLASFLGQTSAVEFLVLHGAGVGMRDQKGDTPLHLAAQKGHKAAVELLLAKGADASAKNNLGFKPVDLVRGRENDDLAALLEQHANRAPSAFRPVAVGLLGDARLLAFEGLKTFTPDQVRSGLAMNPDFLLASHPAAPFDNYLEALHRKVELGYRNGGFPEAKAKASLDEKAGSIRVVVLEGPRFRVGGVQVGGARSVPVDALIRRLTETWPPPDSKLGAFNLSGPRGVTKLESKGEPGKSVEWKGAVTWKESPKPLDSVGREVEPQRPAWEKGEPVEFDEFAARQRRVTVTNALAEFGLFFPRFRLEILRDETKGTADLMVELLDEGPQGVIESIDIIGLKKNSRTDLLRYLDLAPGQPVNRELITRLERQLWRSARFLKYVITPERAGDASPKVRLKIELVEYKAAPPLSKDFSAEQKAMLKLCDWLSSLSSRQEEIVIREDGMMLSRGAGDIIVSEGGLLFQQYAGAAPARTKLEFAVLLTPGLVGHFAPPQRRKLVSTSTDWQLTGSVTAKLSEDPDAETPFNLGISGGFKGFPASTEAPAPARAPPFKLDVSLAPVAFVHLASSGGNKSSIKRGVLTITTPDLTFRCDTETGRLIELTLIETNKVVIARVTAEKGAFARALKEIQSRTASHANMLDPRKSLSSTLAYFAHAALASEFMEKALFQHASAGTTERTRLALSKVINSDLLSPLDALWAEDARAGGEEFHVPLDAEQMETNPMQSAMAAIAAGVFHYCNDLFPKRSWPWTLAHEAVFVLAGNTAYTEAELRRLHDSDETGPIGCLAIARLSALLHSPAAELFARRGLTRLSAADFLNDCRLAFDGDTVLARTAGRMAGGLRDLDDGEIQALGEIISPTAVEALRQAVPSLRERKGQPLTEVLAPVLQELWEQSLRKLVREELGKLAGDERRADAKGGR